MGLSSFSSSGSDSHGSVLHEVSTVHKRDGGKTMQRRASKPIPVGKAPFFHTVQQSSVPAPCCSCPCSASCSPCGWVQRAERCCCVAGGPSAAASAAAPAATVAPAPAPGLCPGPSPDLIPDHRLPQPPTPHLDPGNPGTALWPSIAACSNCLLVSMLFYNEGSL